MKQHDDVKKEIDLMNYRIEKAKNDLKASKTLIGIEDYMGANNRAYYAIFHAISAIHALDGKSYKRHKDTIANFNKDYVKTDIFPKTMGRKISEAEEVRHGSDYDDFYITSKEKSLELIETAEELIKLVEEYCNKRIEE